jgi:hypothetical protein
MKQLVTKLNELTKKPYTIPMLLLVAAALVYGAFFWQMGFYWDDLPISWIRYQFGESASRHYFSTSRPVWGELYQLTTRFIPQVPAYWQLFALFWRWLGVVVLWKAIRILLPDRPQFAFTTSLLFLFYPGFNEQWVSFLFSHFLIVLFFFLLSYLIMIWSFRIPKWYWALTILSMIFSALNVWMMEYFYSLELIRIFVILILIWQENPAALQPRALLRTGWDVLKKWLPFFSVLVLNVLYRTLVFSNLAYQNVFFSELKANFFGAILNLLKAIVVSIWTVSAGAWSQIFNIPDFFSSGPRTLAFYFAVQLVLFLMTMIFQPSNEKSNWKFAASTVALGLLATIFSGGPYWLAKLDISLAFPANRFVVSFMLGATLLLAGILEFIPARFRIFIAAIFIALAAGRHTLWADEFRRDWNTQKNLFWQMTWRAPGLKPDTLVVMNEGALHYYADNSLGAALNWIYDPNNKSDEPYFTDKEIHYTFFYPTNRLDGALPKLEPDRPVEFTFLIGDFSGNTSQMVAFYYAPPKCLRLLDPEIDSNNKLIPDETLLRDAAALSSSKPVINQPGAIMPEVYGPEPAHGWCYYFQKAELARQFGHWEEVTRLGDIAFKLDDYPNDPVERFVFIEGYAHIGNWDKAIELSKLSYKVSKNYVRPPLCKLWTRIGRETSMQNVTLDEVQKEFQCLP